MLWRLLRETFLRRKRRVAPALLAVVLGSALVFALLTTYGDITEKMARELRSYGANILVTPRTESLQVEMGGIAFLPASGQELIQEKDLVRLKTIFWRNNILGFAPFLSGEVEANGEPAVMTGTWFDQEVTIPSGTVIRTGFNEETPVAAQTFRTGVKAIAPWWRVEGAWPAEEEALVGVSLARRRGLKIGDTILGRSGEASRSLKVAGLLITGGFEENQLFVPLPVAQELLGLPGGVSRVQVSALTLPESKLASDLRGKKPDEMTPQQYEKWYCSPVLSAIITQVEEALPGTQARAIRQVSEAEGEFATRTELLVLLVMVVSLLASGLGVMTAQGTLVLERRKEIGLMRALGAEGGQVAFLFLAEAAVVGVGGGLTGAFLGLGLAQLLGMKVFGASVSFSPLILGVVLALALGVALLGSLLPVRRATGMEPGELLRQV